MTDDIVAVFDLGSNSIKYTVARRTGGEDWETLHSGLEAVRLAEGIGATGVIAEDRARLAVSVLRGWADEAREMGANRLVGVGTAVFRQAGNGAAVMARIRAEAGIDAAVIEPDQEAELVGLGLPAGLPMSGLGVVIDIGGASTETVVLRDGRVESAVSRPLGSGKLTDALCADDPPSPTQYDACRDEARSVLRSLDLPATVARLVVTGGTGEFLDHLLDGSGAAHPDRLGEVETIITSVRSTELAGMISAAPARARVFPAGVAIVRAAIDESGPRELRFVESGIRPAMIRLVLAGEWDAFVNGGQTSDDA